MSSEKSTKKHSADLNQVSLQGRLTHDIEMLVAKNGNKYTRFQLAVTPRFGDKDIFISCMAWGEMVGPLSSYGKKGTTIHVQGEISVSMYKPQGCKYTINSQTVNVLNVHPVYVNGSEPHKGDISARNRLTDKYSTNDENTQYEPSMGATDSDYEYGEYETDEMLDINESDLPF